MGEQGGRQERLSEYIRRELGQFMLAKVEDPRLVGVVISEVILSPDLKSGTVFFFTPQSKDSEQAEKAMQKANHFVSKHLTKKMQLRKWPKLRYVYDNTLDNANEIETLLSGLNKR